MNIITLFNISVFVGNANGPVIVSTYESSLRQAGSNQDANNGPFSQQPSYSSTGKLCICVCIPYIKVTEYCQSNR